MTIKEITFGAVGKGRLAGALAGLVAMALLETMPAARGDTIIWANDARGNGSIIGAFDVNEAAGTGMLTISFAAPNAGAQGHIGRGIAVVGSSIFYSVDNSGSVFLTNTSGTDLGVAFNTGLPGIGSIASDGQSLYLTASNAPNNPAVSENVYKYTFGGTLLGATLLVPSAGSLNSAVGRTGLEVVATDFVANQGNNAGPYDQFDATGALLAPAFIPGGFGPSGVTFDGTFYYTADVEAVPSIFNVFNVAGGFVKEISLTGCPGPNQLCDFQDLSVAVAAVSEPASFLLVAIGLLGFGVWRLWQAHDRPHPLRARAGYPRCSLFSAH